MPSANNGMDKSIPYNVQFIRTKIEKTHSNFECVLICI